MTTPSNRLTLRAPEPILSVVLREIDSGEQDRRVDFNKLLPQPELTGMELREWRRKHWGTTYTPGVARFEHEANGEEAPVGERTLLFTTDGGIMTPFVAFLAARHPQLEIDWAYTDASGGYAGRTTFADGMQASTWFSRDREECRQFLREHWQDALPDWLDDEEFESLSRE